MNRKFLLPAAAVVLVASLALAGLALAQEQAQAPAFPAQPTQAWGMGTGRGMMSGGGMMGRGGMAGRGMMGGGVLHEYMQDAWAEALGLTREDLDSRLAAGEMHYSIALALGLTVDEFTALMSEVRAGAIAAAVADGALTEAQADWMLQRMPGRGLGNGNCPMHPQNTAPSQAAPQS
jgi:hypothetical protein